MAISRLCVNLTSALWPTRVVSPTSHLQKPIRSPTVYVLLRPGICKKNNPSSGHVHFSPTWHLQIPILPPTVHALLRPLYVCGRAGSDLGVFVNGLAPMSVYVNMSKEQIGHEKEQIGHVQKNQAHCDNICGALFVLATNTISKSWRWSGFFFFAAHENT